MSLKKLASWYAAFKSSGLRQIARPAAEFDAFLECGILAHGFLRLRGPECAHEKLVAFSCKRRGFCPSCGARRMVESAAHLVERVIPRVAARQWVLSFPIPLRVLFAAHPELLSSVLQIIHRVIATFLIKQAGVKRECAKPWELIPCGAAIKDGADGQTSVQRCRILINMRGG